MRPSHPGVAIGIPRGNRKHFERRALIVKCHRARLERELAELEGKAEDEIEEVPQP